MLYLEAEMVIVPREMSNSIETGEAVTIGDLTPRRWI